MCTGLESVQGSSEGALKKGSSGLVAAVERWGGGLSGRMGERRAEDRLWRKHMLLRKKGKGQEVG